MDGDPRMKERPMTDLIEAVKDQKGVSFHYLGKDKSIPFELASEGFEGGEIQLNSSESSQFVSALLMSAPYAKNSVKLVLKDVTPEQKVLAYSLQLNKIDRFGVLHHNDHRNDEDIWDQR